MVAAVRRLEISFPLQSGRVNLCATLQKPREIREKNHDLLKVASTLQEGMLPSLPRSETWKCVFWASNTVVIADHRICKVTGNLDGTYKISFTENWHSPRIFNASKSELEYRIRGWLSADGRPAL